MRGAWNRRDLGSVVPASEDPTQNQSLPDDAIPEAAVGSYRRSEITTDPPQADRAEPPALTLHEPVGVGWVVPTFRKYRELEHDRVKPPALTLRGPVDAEFMPAFREYAACTITIESNRPLSPSPDR